MIRFREALYGGFIATFAASVMMQMNNAIGKIPEVHVATTLSSIMGAPDRLTGWMTHFLLGVIIFPLVFSLLERRLPVRTYAIKGLLFGLLLWLGMMTVFMPAADAGMFGLARGAVVPVATLVLNLFYGLILGIFYGWDLAPVRKAAIPST
ncbi:MAG: DUF6789 family protein [Burkholderiales bacterium]